MLRVIASVFIVTVLLFLSLLASDAHAQNQNAGTKPPLTVNRAPDPSERIKRLESDLADREEQNAALIERLNDLEAEIDALKRDLAGVDSVAKVNQAANSLDQSLKVLEQRLGSAVYSR